MSGFALAEEGTSKCGNHYISMFSSTCHNHVLILDTFALNVSIVCINYTCRSEGPAQVFFAVAHLAHSCIWKEEEGRLEKVTVSYDNMCHLNNLKVARGPLPLPGDLAYL